MTFIKVNICLNDVTNRRKANNGKTYADLVVTDLTEPDDKGNTLTVYNELSKDQRDAGEKRVYCGRGKHMTTSWSEKAINPTVNDVEQPDDDLPF